jgi:hypothetical protein
MQHKSEADETFGTYTCNIYLKHMQHPNKTLATCNMKHLLQHKIKTTEAFRTYSCNICVKLMQHPDKKRLQHMSEIDETF